MATAWLTPAFAEGGAWRGAVHSTFDRVVNLLLHRGDAARLFTLCAPGLPRLPDAARVPPATLAALREGEAARLEGECLTVGSLTLRLTPEPWRGEIPVYGRSPDPECLRLLRGAPVGGLWRLPPIVREATLRALRSGDGRRYLGLGPGLTPAFDDACVGAMAARKALGVAAPFRLGALESTTDVSARYLRLATEGYFGEPLCALVAALFGHGAPEPALAELTAVGATSGLDMLAGVLTTLDACSDTFEETAIQCGDSHPTQPENTAVSCDDH